jgi:hypothetical protein
MQRLAARLRSGHSWSVTTDKSGQTDGRKSWWRRGWALVSGAVVFLGLGSLLGARLLGWFDTNVIDRERVSIAVVEDPREYLSTLPNWESFEWVFPDETRTSLPGPTSDDCRERWPWARRLGGIDALQSRIRVYVTGDGVEDVVLDGVRVRVHERDAPAKGIYAQCPVGGASISPRQILVDLDRERPRLTYLAEGGNQSEPFAFVFPKGKTEREVFDVVGYATRCTCTWDVEFTFRVGDERTAVVRHFPSRPLRTTGIGAANAVTWRAGRWRASTS